MLDLPISVLLNFKNTSNRFYKYQWPSYIIKFKHIPKKIFDFLLCFKGIRWNKLEVDFNIGGGWLGHLDLVTHPDMNPVQQGLTSVNRREPVFSKGNSYQVFCYICFSKDQQFSSKFFEESFFLRSKLYNYFSPSDIPSNNENKKFNYDI